MGLEEILQDIDRSTKESVERIMADANAEAERILAQAEAAAKEQEQAAKERAENEARQLVARNVSKASIAAKMAYYNEVNKRVEAAISGIRNSLPSYAKGQGYKKLMAALAEKAVGQLGADCTLFVQRGDEQAVAYGKKRLNVATSSESFAGGLKALSADGRRELDYTLEALLERVHDKVVMKLLEHIKAR